MADMASLTAAHAHARRAADHTAQVNWDRAVTEHQEAAADFARASRGTSDHEALRVLQLLEEQHRRLARIIRSQTTVDLVEGTRENAELSPPSQATVDPKEVATSTTKVSTTVAKPRTSALASARIGSQVRESSPSLAREIASRRGIPPAGNTRPSAAAQARARQLSPESLRRAKHTMIAPKIPPSIVDSQAQLQNAQRLKRDEDDEGFAKFYNTLTSGTMSKLSSVLAYAGLPLTADDIKIGFTPVGRTVKANDGPDVKRIFSKAALDAIEDEHRQRGTLGHGFGPAESFYVVPPTGLTKPYAQMARESQRLSGLGEDDEDAFVDAKEAQGPPPPKHSRSEIGRRSFGKDRTEEELELENATLKSTMEQLLSRLQQFEVHAQDASMAALTQSMMVTPRSGGDVATAERLRQLEQQVEKEVEKREKLEAHAIQQEKMLKKFNYKYEKLKSGAREKMKEKEKAGSSAKPDVIGAITTDVGWKS